MKGRILTNGKTEAEMPDYRETGDNGQQKAYVMLSDDESAKGFVRPVRTTYVHVVRACGRSTTMGLKIAETYARDPKFYGATFCLYCGAHYPVSEFNWEDTNEAVGS